MAARRYGTDEPSTLKPRNDAYVGLLVISLLAMLVGCLLLFLDMNSYPQMEPPKVEQVVGPAKGKGQ